MTSQEGRDVLLCIINGCGDPTFGINAGTMLRQCISVRCIHEVLLSNPSLLEPLFTRYAMDDNFDISSDVFQSIHDLLIKNKQLVSSYLHPSKPLNQQVHSVHDYHARYLGGVMCCCEVIRISRRV